MGEAKRKAEQAAAAAAPDAAPPSLPTSPPASPPALADMAGASASRSLPPISAIPPGFIRISDVADVLNAVAVRPKVARKIMIAIPAFTGKIDQATIISCQEAQDAAIRLGWEVVLVVRSGDSILPRARDVLFTMFWDSDCSDMLFVDADIAWDPGVFTKIMSHEVDKHGRPIEMIGGVYCGRGNPPNYVCIPLNAPGGGTSLDVDYQKDPGPLGAGHGIAEVKGLGTGFLRITRTAAKRLIESLPPDHWYKDDFTAKGMKVWHLFDFTFDARQDPGMRLRGEDYVFCDRFRAAGGRLWADVELTLHHAGGERYTGHFGNFLRAGGGGMKPPGQGGGNAGPVGPPPPAAGMSLADAVERMAKGAE
jgi:hypothetical protein